MPTFSAEQRDQVSGLLESAATAWRYGGGNRCPKTPGTLDVVLYSLPRALRTFGAPGAPIWTRASSVLENGHPGAVSA